MIALSTLLEIRNLTFHYPDGRMALRDVSFRMEHGESVGLIGPNGAGKSTLLMHLNGILPGRSDYEHHHGMPKLQRHSHDHEPHVWVTGLPVIDRNLPDVRRRVGLVFQDPDDQLFCPSVVEDVMFGPRNLGYSIIDSQAISQKCLERVGLAGFEERLPHHLSLGERKRICLAGVLACEPLLLALDEPSGNLDPATRGRFIQLLRELPASKIIATHDLGLVRELCPRVILLDQGEIRADGPTQELLNDEELLSRHEL